MSPPRKAGSRRDATGCVEVMLGPELLADVRELEEAGGGNLSALVRDLLRLHLEAVERGAASATSDAHPVPAPHGLRAMGARLQLARLPLGDEAGLARALAAVPPGWSARVRPMGRVVVEVRPDAAWAVIDG